MKKLIYSLFSQKNISFYILVLLGATFLSIPLFSFVGKLYAITWVLTILLIGFIFLFFILYKPIKITFITISLILFCFFALISSLLTGFKSFLATPLLNVIVILILYSYYSSQTNEEKKKGFSVLYLALIIFGIIFAGLYLYYRFILKISLSGSRFGSEFGDENDISILLALGFAFSFFYIFKSKKWYLTLLNSLFSILFVAVSFLCGSKIAIVIVLLISFIIIGLHFGAKRWYLTLLIMIAVVGGIVFALQLSMFSALKDRFLNMIYSFVGKQYKNLNPDSSTSGRLEMIINGFSLFLRRPLFGFGLNGYHVFSTHHSGWSHNHWSDTFCNYGLIGSFFYHLPLVLFFKKLRNKKSFSLIGIIFFLISTISIALFKEKMFAYSAGLFLADANLPSVYEIRLFRKKVDKADFPHHEKIELVEIIPSLNPVGGAETMFVNFCEEIKKHHSNDVHLNVVILYKYEKNALYDRLEKLGISIHFLDKHKGLDFVCAQKLGHILDTLKPDLIHTHLGTSVTLMLALKFKKRFPIVHTFHHMVGTGFKKELFNRFLIKKKIIHPVAVSELSSKSIEAKTKQYCPYIDNGINVDNYDSALPVNKRQLDFLCVASFRPVKNQKYLINVFKELIAEDDRFSLTFLGSGSMLQMCMEQSKPYLDKNIFFKGSVDDVNKYMANSKILVLTSTSEGNPMVVNEALASGMYVIANNVGGLPNLIHQGITGDLVPVDDLSAFKNMMLQRITDIEFLEKRRVANINDIEKYSIKNSVNNYIDLFRKLC